MRVQYSDDFDLDLKPVDPKFHTNNGFREQVALLFYFGTVNDRVILGRSFISVGTPGAVQYDSDSPGQDTLRGWQYIDKMIETENVAGVFHTHPPGMSAFSGQDRTVQHGFAMSYGDRPLWYGVQAQGRDESVCCCLYMKAGTVFRFNFGSMYDFLSNPTLVLPIPPLLEVPHSGMIEVNSLRHEPYRSGHPLMRHYI